jgi:hypothetical protein
VQELSTYIETKVLNDLHDKLQGIEDLGVAWRELAEMLERELPNQRNLLRCVKNELVREDKSKAASLELLGFTNHARGCDAIWRVRFLSTRRSTIRAQYRMCFDRLGRRWAYSFTKICLDMWSV